MGYRLGWLAGIAGILFALARAGRLLRPSLEGPSWQVILLAVAALGAAITWALVSYRIRARWIVLINMIAVSLTVTRLAVPDTTWLIFPTAASLDAMATEMTFAREVIRAGVAPVIPLAGIVALLAVVFWGLGALLSWGLLSNRPYPAVLAPLVVYLEFAVIDRRPGGTWATAFMIMIGLALMAVAMDRRRAGTGVLMSVVTRRPIARSLPSMGAVALTAAVIVAVTVSGAMAHMVPRSGYLEWRAQTGLSGEHYGSISYNPFVGIHQSLVSPSNTPVFIASVDGDIDRRRLSWRLVTLDTFDGAQWHLGRDISFSYAQDVDRFEAASTAFQGPTAPVRSDVSIAALQMDWLPAPYSPTALSSSTIAIDRGVRIREADASLRFDALTYRGMTYTVHSDVPQPDIGALSLRADGTPSAMFAAAIAEGAFTPSTAPPPAPRPLPNAARFLGLPDGLDPGIAALARTQVAGAETDFERAIALESFFRASGAFTYSTDISPGHGAEDLAAWLLDPASNNHRVGYCEQFSTGMAVMARTLGIPSRVVLGFTPGTPDAQGNIVVRDRNAHAWVELWMPTQGWVQFDPTPRGDRINPPTSDLLRFDVARYLEAPDQPGRGAGPLPGGTPREFEEELIDGGLEEVPEPPAEPADGISLPRVPGLNVVALPLFAALLLSLLPAAKWHRRRKRLRRLDEGDVAAAWSEIVDRLTDLGDPPRVTATPVEVAHRATPALGPLAHVYTEATYGPGPLTPERLAVASRSLHDTHHQLTGRYSLGRRIRSHYRLASVLPVAWRIRRANGFRRRR